jgi:HD superfamily phosphohydrolase
MNSKQVLDRIVSMLSLTKKEEEEVEMTYAKLKDGTIVESPTFDVGESLDIVSEDGTLTPAPDGEHEVSLKDTEGNEVLMKVITKDGKIVERENVELQEEGEEEVKEEAIEDIVAALIDTLTPDEVSSEVAEDIAEKVLDALEDKIEIFKKRKSTKMAEEEGSPFDIKKIEEMAYRIEELEKRIAKMEEVKEEVEEDMEEEDLPKLDGAPIEEKASKFSTMKPKNILKESNPQGSFLEKLYK